MASLKLACNIAYFPNEKLSIVNPSDNSINDSSLEKSELSRTIDTRELTDDGSEYENPEHQGREDDGDVAEGSNPDERGVPHLTDVGRCDAHFRCSL